jgi:hypothetical protein
MNSTEAFRNYRHDILGKFKDISLVINSFDEDSFSDPEKYEMFHAIHEVIIKMVKTSRNTIAQQLRQEIRLNVSDHQPDLNLPKIQIEGVTVRYSGDSSKMQYFYYKSENKGDFDLNLVILKSFLPFNSTLIEG